MCRQGMNVEDNSDALSLCTFVHNQKWKAFAATVESFMKSAKKNKDPAATLDAYKAAVTAMEGYLVEVELPPTAEL